MFKRKTETEKNLETALSNENWGASGTTNAKLAESSILEEDFKCICSTLWKTLDIKNKQWRQIFKALSLIEYLIKNGVPQFVDECRDNIYYIRSFENFQCKEGELERGQGVRDKVTQILELLDDDDKIRMERKKARKFKRKFAGKAMSCGSAPAKPEPKKAAPKAEKPQVDNTGIALPMSGKATFGVFGLSSKPADPAKPVKEVKPKEPKPVKEPKKLAPTQFTASDWDPADDSEDEEEPEPAPAPAPVAEPKKVSKKPVKKQKTEADVLFNFSAAEGAEEPSNDTSMFDNMSPAPSASPAPRPAPRAAPAARSPAVTNNLVAISPEPVSSAPVVIPDGPLPDNLDDFLGDAASKITSGPLTPLPAALPKAQPQNNGLFGGLVSLDITPDPYHRPGMTVPSNRPAVPISAYQQQQQQQPMNMNQQQQYMMQQQQYMQQQQQMRGQMPMNNMNQQQQQQYMMQQQYMQQQQMRGQMPMNNMNQMGGYRQY
ncbi:hypothetical protein WA158_004670 [Blastocystis sp. Blastoise]